MLGTLAASSAVASVGTVSETDHFSGVLGQETTTNPCTNGPGVLTLDAKTAVAHMTTNDNGFWATFTAQGTATFDPDNAPPVSGHFTAWDRENGNLKNGTATGTFTVHIDGVMMHETFHESMSATGLTGLAPTAWAPRPKKPTCWVSLSA